MTKTGSIGNRFGLAVCACTLALATFGATDVRPLVPLALEPLPLGGIRPEGWLARQLDRMTEGLVGRLYEHSDFLKPNNGWLCAEGRDGWEEQPYWLRSFVKLAVLTQNARCLDVARDWVEKVLATRQPDGWFGPKTRRGVVLKDGTKVTDIWGHMVMFEALESWWEYTRDPRIPALFGAFCRFCLTLPDDAFVTPEPKERPADWNWQYKIQWVRAADMQPVLQRLFARTGDADYLRLADRLVRHARPVNSMWLSLHNVDFVQALAYRPMYGRRTHDPADLASADYWYDLHHLTWGQMPRGAFAADEMVRYGRMDPRQATESCTWAEFTRTCNNLGNLSGETKWADRNEDVVFNHAPCSYLPDWSEVRYLVSPNMTSADSKTDYDYCNLSPMVAFSANAYRCCRHNAALTFPLFTQNLVKRAADGALVFWMYAPHRGETTLSGDNRLSWRLDTRYPFRETARITVRAAKPAELRFRVPGWARGFRVTQSKAGRVQDAPGGASWLDVAVGEGETVLDLAFRAETVFTHWPRTGAVTVDRGPLSYSLAIGERYDRVVRPKRVGGSLVWPEKNDHKGNADMMTEIAATTPWNYGLDVARPLEYRECAWSDDCFTATNAVCEIFAIGRRLPEWTLQDNQPAPLQRSPALTDAPAERLRFVPLGCQRLRLSVLPKVTDDPTLGWRWCPTPETTDRATRPSIGNPSLFL